MTDIIERLKEPEAHYPGNFDTPKRANAMLSCLCQEAAEEIESMRRELTEANAEIERLKLAANIGKSKDVHALAEILLSDCGCSTEYRALLDKVENRLWTFFDEQLAASQAREQQLREALNQGYGWAPIGSTSKQIMGLALALQQDTSALEALIAKAGEVMRERCAVECETHYNFSNALAAAIRALHGVTLEDIK